jgi:hypothetical protein
MKQLSFVDNYRTTEGNETYSEGHENESEIPRSIKCDEH